MDVVVIATLGMGSVAGGIAKIGRSATLFRAGVNAGAKSAGQVTARAAFNGGRGMLGRLSSITTKIELMGSRWTAFRSTFTEFTHRVLPTVSLGEKLRAGLSTDIAQLAKDMTLLSQQLGHPVNVLFRGGVSSALFFLRLNVAIDVLGKSLGGTVVGQRLYEIPGWEAFKAKFVVGFGTPWR